MVGIEAVALLEVLNWNHIGGGGTGGAGAAEPGSRGRCAARAKAVLRSLSIKFLAVLLLLGCGHGK